MIEAKGTLATSTTTTSMVNAKPSSLSYNKQSHQLQQQQQQTQQRRQHKPQQQQQQQQQQQNQQSQQQNYEYIPAKAKQLKKSKLNTKLAQLLKTYADNKQMYAALLLRSPDDIIHIACQNIVNIENIAMLEWSEAVLLQLCTLKEFIVLENFLDWAQLEQFIRNNQWSVEVTFNLKKYINSKITLLSIMNSNRIQKINRYNLPKEQCFVTEPYICYEYLKTYRLNVDIIAKPYSECDFLPVKFNKIINKR